MYITLFPSFSNNKKRDHFSNTPPYIRIRRKAIHFLHNFFLTLYPDVMLPPYVSMIYTVHSALQLTSSGPNSALSRMSSIKHYQAETFFYRLALIFERRADYLF